jgi:hypothetical protein
MRSISAPIPPVFIGSFSCVNDIYMLQMIKRYFWMVLLIVGLEHSRGFSLLGPLPPDVGGEPWQIDIIGYNLGYYQDLGIPGGPVWLGDIGGPHNLGEEYRRNAPILYYTYDPSFTEGDFFGAEALAAVDGAFGIINSLTNVDKYSPSLSEVPLSAQHYNYTAESLYLTDLKSVTLHCLVEQLGLADPARYSWTLHDRWQSPTPCPIGTYYLVVQRNFDGISVPSLQNLAYSPYVNNELLSYYITEHCTGPPPDLADTVPYLTDPTGTGNTPVAANNFEDYESELTFEYSQLLGIIPKIPTIYGLQVGGYYTGLTRDDLAGLRYLFSTNNANVEPIPASALLFSVVTNLALPTQLFPNGTGTNNTGTNGGFYYYDGTYGYGDYGWLVASSITNSPAVLQALYPGLLIASSTNYFVLATNWTYAQYFTNAGYGQPYPPVLTLVTVSNAHPYLLEKYVTTFANVFPDPGHKGNYSPNTVVKRQTITVVPNTGAPYPSPPVTNITTQTITYTGVPSGDFLLLPLFHTNICPVDFLYAGLTNVLAITNVLTGTITNLVTATNTSTYSSTLTQINYFTNYIWVIQPVTCSELTNAPGRYRGLGGIKFVRAVPAYDYLLNQYVTPITNYYDMVAQNLTNNQWEVKHIVRIVTQPDILLTAADAASGQGAAPFNFTIQRDIRYNSTQIIPGLHGPGTIDGQVVFNYNKAGPVYYQFPFTDANSFINPNEVNEITQLPLLQWASFDGSTNDPVLYPNTTSLQNLEYQALAHLTVTPSGPLVGYAGAAYSVQFSVTGGALEPAFTWSVSGSLPPGLSVSANGGYIGTLAGTPTAAGTYDFTLQLTDALGHSVHWPLAITIN